MTPKAKTSTFRLHRNPGFCKLEAVEEEEDHASLNPLQGLALNKFQMFAARFSEQRPVSQVGTKDVHARSLA